jgi:hypothetical protein
MLDVADCVHDIVERLRIRRIEAGAFERVSTPTPSPLHPVKLTSFVEPEYTVPLQEIDILVDGCMTEAAVIDPGSQIVAIRKDLADSLAMKPNPDAALEMEAANSATNWTLGCVEYLTLQIGDIPFKVHAHVIEDTPFRVLLSRPFQRVVLSILEDRPDGCVDLTIRDPRDRAHCLTVTAREWRIQVRYVRILVYQCSPPPRMNALERYVSNTVPPTPVLAYKKAAKKVHPVAASLPEDFHVIR